MNADVNLQVEPLTLSASKLVSLL